MGELGRSDLASLAGGYGNSANCIRRVHWIRREETAAETSRDGGSLPMRVALRRGIVCSQGTILPDMGFPSAEPACGTVLRHAERTRCWRIRGRWGALKVPEAPAPHAASHDWIQCCSLRVSAPDAGAHAVSRRPRAAPCPEGDSSGYKSLRFGNGRGDDVGNKYSAGHGDDDGIERPVVKQAGKDAERAAEQEGRGGDQ